MGVMAHFHVQKMFSFRYFFLKRIGVLDSYFIHWYIVIKYCQVCFRENLPIIMKVMALFSTSFFAKCLRVGEDGPGLGHLCHTDMFLVFFFFFFFSFFFFFFFFYILFDVIPMGTRRYRSPNNVIFFSYTSPHSFWHFVVLRFFWG